MSHNDIILKFEKVIAQSGASDVREILDYYNEQIDPLEAFKINQVKLQVMGRPFFLY